MLRLPRHLPDKGQNPPPPAASRQKDTFPPQVSRKKDTTPPTSRKKEAPITIAESPVRRVPSSPVAMKSTDIRSFFNGGNKENLNPVKPTLKNSKVEKKDIKGKGKEKEKPVVKSEKVKPEKKKRKTEDEDEDFVMMDDEEKDEPEDDLESDAEDGDAHVESGGDDLQSEHESGESASGTYSWQQLTSSR
jgi:hypothetical protein